MSHNTLCLQPNECYICQEGGPDQIEKMTTIIMAKWRKENGKPQENVYMLLPAKRFVTPFLLVAHLSPSRKRSTDERHYMRNRGVLKNVPYVDNSYKWAGGGILSTVEDLIKFGNILLYSYQKEEEDDVSQRGFLKASTMEDMWTPVPNTKMGWDKHGSYALGWAVVDVEENPAKYCDFRRFYVSHTGGAVGASSVLLILPQSSENEHLERTSSNGIVVAIISNVQNFAGINALALEVAKIFSRVECKPKDIEALSGPDQIKLHSVNDARA